MNTIKLQSVLPNAFSNHTHVVSEIWLQEKIFQKGKIYLIEAGSGTGKTSLCSFLFGYRNEYQGNIYFDSRNIREFSKNDWNIFRNNSLSMVFQDLRLFPELNALENILIKNNLTSFKNSKWIENAFEHLGIADKIFQPVSKLSFGQQQRIALIRALCQPMDFIILDEPISHLDSVNSKALASLLTKEASNQSAGVIITSIGKHPDLQYDEILSL